MEVIRNGEDFWDQPYYWFTKTVLRAIGHWPYQPREEFIMCRIVLHFTYWIQILPQIVAVARNYKDFDLIMEMSSAFATDIAALVNLCTFVFTSAKIQHLLEQMKEDWGIFPQNNGLQLLHQYTEKGHRRAVLYSGSLYVAWFIFVSEPVHVRLFRIFIPSNNSVPRKFVVPMDYGSLDVGKYYYSLLVIEAISVLGIVSVVIAADILLFLYAQHACGLFAALGFSSVIDDIFCWNFFVMIGLIMMVISTTAVQMVTNLDAVARLLKTLAYAFALICHLYVQCSMSQQLTDSSIGAQQSLMNAKWYLTTTRTRQLVQFMTLRSQRPCYLTAGRFLLMSLSTFSSIIRMSVTYFTVFLDMQ